MKINPSRLRNTIKKAVKEALKNPMPTGAKCSLSGKTAERYVEALEKEKLRTRLYTELLTAQLARDSKKAEKLQEQFDDLEGEGDY